MATNKYPADVTKLQKAVLLGPKTMEQLCDLFNMGPKSVRRIIQRAEKLGLNIGTQHDHIAFAPPKKMTFEDYQSNVKTFRVRPVEDDWYRFAVFSDVHVGSRFFLKAFYLDFLQKAYNEYGVRNFFCAGDWLDGTYHHSLFEQEQVGFENQSQELLNIYPDLPDAWTDFIIGNHEHTMREKSGVEIGDALVNLFKANGKPRIRYLGPRLGGIRLKTSENDKRGIGIELWHPRGGNPYARSYKLQKKIEAYAPGLKPDLLFVGHHHLQCYIVSRGIHAFMAGTFHGHGGDFGNSLVGDQNIGGHIVEFKVTKDGTLRDVRSVWIAYYENEKPRQILYKG